MTLQCYNTTLNKTNKADCVSLFQQAALKNRNDGVHAALRLISGIFKKRILSC